MSKTFKLSLIFLVTVANLVIFRMIFSVLNLSDNLSNWLFSTLFQVICMGVIPYLMYRFLIGKEFKLYTADMHLNRHIHPLSYLLAVGIGLLVFILNNAFSSFWYGILTAIGYKYVSSVGTIYSSPEVLVFEIITSCMMPAVFEELTDRGLLLAALDESGMKDVGKIAIVGIFFGFLHQNITQFLPTIFGGIVMAIMAVKCRSIYPTIIVHFLNNFIISMYDFSDQMGGNFATIYNNIYASCTSSYFAYLGVVLFAMLLLMLLLKIFVMINAKYRQKAVSELVKNEPVNAQSTDEEDAGVYRVSSDEYFMTNVYPKLSEEYLAERKNKKSNTDINAPAVRKSHAKWWEYGMMITAAVLATATTIFTLWWGMLR